MSCKHETNKERKDRQGNRNHFVTFSYMCYVIRQWAKRTHTNTRWLIYTYIHGEKASEREREWETQKFLSDWISCKHWFLIFMNSALVLFLLLLSQSLSVLVYFYAFSFTPFPTFHSVFCYKTGRRGWCSLSREEKNGEWSFLFPSGLCPTLRVGWMVAWPLSKKLFQYNPSIASVGGGGLPHNTLQRNSSSIFTSPRTPPFPFFGLLQNILWHNNFFFKS